MLLVALVFVAAGLVKGVIGMGLPTVAMGLLSLMMPPASAAAMLIVPSLVTNLWQLLTGPNFMTLARRLALMMAGLCVGTFASIGVLTNASTAAASAGLGAALALYGVIGLSGRHFAVSPRVEPWLSPAIGLLSGLISGATGVFVIPAVPYLSALGLQRDQLIQALGLSFTVSTISLALALAASGRYPVPTIGSSAFAVIPAVAGMLFGQQLRRHLSPERFRRIFFVGLMVLGGYMAARLLIP